MPQLQDPIMPNSNAAASIQYVAHGLSAMVANRQYQQKLELANQKMIQDAALDQEKFQLAREKLAGDMQVQNAQIDNYHAEAELRRSKVAQDHADVQDGNAALQEYMKVRPTFNWGTDIGESQILDAQATFGDALNTKKGSQIFKEDAVKQRFHARATAQLDQSMTNQYNDMLKKKGIGDPGMLNTLEYDPATGKFTPNQYWGKDQKTGNPYTIWDSKTGQAVPVETVAGVNGKGGMSEADQAKAGYFRAGFTEPELKSIWGLKSRIENRRSLAAPPIKDQVAVAQEHQTAQATAAISARSSTAPSDAKIARLRSHPEERDLFDAAFGAGAAKGVLGY